MLTIVRGITGFLAVKLLLKEGGFTTCHYIDEALSVIAS
jgi:hypothetical protein